jgi:flagellin
MTMISINTNYGGIFAAKASSQSQGLVDTAMERLSTGKRINKASDDSAGQAIATRLTAEIEGLAMASRNVADAQSMVDTAEGAMQEVHSILLRMRELAVQSANGTLTDSDRDHTDAEFQQLEAEITRISDNTKWAGKGLLDGSLSTSAVSFQIGEGANQTIAVTVANVAASTIGAVGTAGSVVTSLGAADLQSSSNAQVAIQSVDAAIASISTERGKLGAVSNRLESTMNNLDQINLNLSASKARIEDADFAAETGNLAKGQILQQAATAMLAQANASKQQVLTLIR